jgi:translation initiation factor IF-2
MSVRIHQLSKKIGIENKELISLLQERGFSVKSASSTIDNISAESLLDEFKTKRDEEERKAADEKERQAAEVLQDDAQDSAQPDIEEEIPAKAEPVKPSIKLPPGVFVKSADDVRREREERAAAARPAPAQPVPAAQPSAPAPSSRPAPMPPPPVSRPPAPAPVSPMASAAPRGPGTPPPLTPPPLRKAPAPTPTPPAPGGSSGSRPPETPQPSEVTQAEASADAAAPTEGAAAEETKVIQIKPPIVVRDFAGLIGLKPFRLISELMEMNIFASMNQTIEEHVATDLAARHGFLLDIRHRGEQAAPAKEKKEVKVVDESKFLEPRPPVVCILGHVDHGKTTLLDNIRKANVVAGEAGGITQHIGAYQVEQGGRKITFLDTPGHAAFSKMRARGANLTDIAILVVAADDGFMPQTDEALKHAQAAKVPLVVALNKMDARGANPDRVKKQMQDRGIAPEDWGGETITVPVSALKGEGIDDLLEMVLLQAEVLELRANPKAPASGIVVEAQVEVGRGPTATVIIQKGTLKTGDALVCGSHYCKVRAMFDDQGKPVKSALPATPVRVIGWSDAPDAGAIFEAVKNEREAKSIAEENEETSKKKASVSAPAPRATLDDLFLAIASQKKKTFRAVVRCDVHGSMEAVVGALTDIKSDKVDVEVVQADVGLISQSDVLLASAAGAAIIGFNVKMENGVKNLAKHHGVAIQTHSIIYELIDNVKLAMADLLDPEIREIKLGAAEVRQIFPVAKAFVAGCLITEGKIVRDSKVRLLRQGKTVFEGKVSTLKRFKDDVTEVRAGYECGIRIDEFNAYQPGDIIEAFEIQKLRANL